MNKENQPYVNVDYLIDNLRKKKGYGISWDQVHKDIGISKHMLKSILDGNQPGLITMVKVCNWLGENIYDFIEYTNDKTFVPITRL